MQQSSTATETLSMTAKMSVWWNISNSQVSKASDVPAILHNLRSTLLKMKYLGQVYIHAYGDVTRITSSVKEALAGAGVVLNHVPPGFKDAIHDKILVDMLLWAVDNDAPANYLLISDDRDSSDILRQLRLRGYIVLLAKNLFTENVTPLKKAPHEYVKVANPRSHYNKQIIPLGKIHRDRSNGRAPTAISSTVEPVEDLVGVVLLALDTLRKEKVIPTHANIIDCIRCSNGGSDEYQIVDINRGLYNAIKRLMINKIRLGSLELFIFRGQNLWSCINPMGGKTKDYPETTWDRIRNFLKTSGRSMMYTSNTRYEAAFILRRTCLKELNIGSVIQILNIVVTDKKWIINNPSGWQPITVKVV